MKERIRNAIEISRLITDDWEVLELQRIARIIHRIDERSCNGYADTDWGRKQEARDEKKVERLEVKGQNILDKYGLFFYRQSDPRGWPVYLLPKNMENKSGNYNKGCAVCPF